MQRGRTVGQCAADRRGAWIGGALSEIRERKRDPMRSQLASFGTTRARLAAVRTRRDARGAKEELAGEEERERAG